MRLIENLNWRYATKQFDPTRQISNEDLAKLKTAIQLSASSYGLQLYKVLIVENKDLRAKLHPASWGQTQIVDASHLLVFCHYDPLQDGHVDDFVALKAEKMGIAVDDLAGYGDFIKSKLATQTADQKAQWMSKQTYIALANLLAACAELKIDACPMEGFDASQYNEILGLKEKGLSAAVVVTIGYRSAEDKNQHAPKVRKSEEDLFEHV